MLQFKPFVLNNIHSKLSLSLWQLEDGFHAAAGFSSDVATQAGAVATHAVEQAGEICRKVIEVSWKVCHHQALPDWLQDNDYLIWGHRPPLPSFSACFQSIFRIHTETVKLCHNSVVLKTAHRSCILHQESFLNVIKQCLLFYSKSLFWY